MNRILIIILIHCIAFTISCKNPGNTSDALANEVILPDDFQDFLDMFHADIDFQKAHIQFPVQGLPTMMDSSYVAGSYLWQEEDWIMHQEFDPDNDEFEQSFALLGDDLIIEKIIHINRSIGMERRFARTDDTWNLIYYAGMNFIKQE